MSINQKEAEALVVEFNQRALDLIENDPKFKDIVFLIMTGHEITDENNESTGGYAAAGMKGHANVIMFLMKQLVPEITALCRNALTKQSPVEMLQRLMNTGTVQESSNKDELLN